LEGVAIEKGGLHRMKPAAWPAKALDRGDCPSLDLCCESEAGEDASAIDVHGASTALSLVAAFLGAGEADMVTQRVEQCDAWLNGERVRLGVYVEVDDGWGRHGAFPYVQRSAG
jgi:hypothetical protein